METAYNCIWHGAEIPKYLNELWEMSDIRTVKAAVQAITSEIEHQGTLWHSTPFAMIFLARIFKRALADMEKDKTALYLTEQLLDFFMMIAECFHEVDGMGGAQPLPLLSDMLKEEYLWSEEYDECEDVNRWEKEGADFPTELVYSCWYYSYQVLVSCKPLILELKNSSLQEMAEELIELMEE